MYITCLKSKSMHRHIYAKDGNSFNIFIGKIKGKNNKRIRECRGVIIPHIISTLLFEYSMDHVIFSTTTKLIVFFLLNFYFIIYLFFFF